MRTPSFAALMGLGICLLSSSCRKEIPTVLNGYFYTTDSSSSEEPLYLYLDGEKKGVLPHIPGSVPFEELSPEDSIVKVIALPLDFMSGRHLVESRRADGSLVASGDFGFYFYKNKTESKVTSPKGGAGSYQIGQKVSIYVGSVKE